MSSISEEDVLRSMEEALELPAGRLSVDTEADQIEKWDSLGHLSILTGLDVLFAGRVGSISELANADSVPKILRILRAHSLVAGR